MRKPYIKFALLLLVLVVIGGSAYLAYRFEKPASEEAAVPAGPAVSAVVFDQAAWEQPLPDETQFETVAQSDSLTLKAHKKTGHFIVEDKRNGSVWRSFPNPKDWEKEKIGGVWRNNLRSPVMYETIDLSKKNLPPSQLSNLIQDQGAVADWQSIDGGFRLNFVIPSRNLSIPVEVRINQDYVETKIIDKDLLEHPANSLVNLRIYPFFGAEQSTGQDGYLFVPDGSGALIRFNPDRIQDKSVYNSRVYGLDFTFEHTKQLAFRQPVNLPVFGMKSGESGFIAVIRQGAEYAGVYASPSGSYSQYNWITADMNYRLKFRLVTLRGKTPAEDKWNDYYNPDRFHADRSIRYYLLDRGDADYSGMAERFRKHLMEEEGLKPLQPKSRSKVPMHVSILGGDTEKGFFSDRYVTGTTIPEAMQMIRRLYGLGIDNMTVTYAGWQQGGFSESGGHFPVDERLGGDKGMRQLIQLAGSLGIPVYLQGEYFQNNSGGDGFDRSQDGVRDLSQTVIGELVSPKFALKTIGNDLPQYKELGAAGVLYTGIGSFLNSDFNTNHAASRLESREIQEQILEQTKQTVGGVQLMGANMYAFQYADHIFYLPDDYSYELFIDEQIPFLEMSLHGLKTYSFGFSNQRQQYRQEFLRSIEYGASPSYLFAEAPGEKLKHTHSFSEFYSTGIKDWEQTAVAEYQRYNDALGDVQDQFIVKHRALAENVYETTYSGGKKIIVNYNPETYSDGSLQVPAEDFIVVNGGA